MLNGYHASGEQFSPSQLLDCVQAAECAGLQAIMTSDHLAPWSERQGNSGNNCAWLGAAMAKTTLPFGGLAIPGGWRYHPVVLAHLITTRRKCFRIVCAGSQWEAAKPSTKTPWDAVGIACASAGEAHWRPDAAIAPHSGIGG